MRARVEALVRLVRGRPVRPVPLAAVLVVVLLVGLFVVQYRRAQARLDDKQDQLDTTRDTLAAVRTDLREVRDRLALTDDDIDLTRTEIDDAIAAAIWIEATIGNTYTEIATVEADRTAIDAASVVVAAHSDEARACFDGVSVAMHASRRGDDRTVVDALDGAADNCTQVLAYATGARFPYDFPDPFVLRAGDAYYGYSTNSGAGDIQVIRSTDLVTWQLVGNALADLPGWAASNTTWAPAVLQRDGHYVVYYTVREAASQQQCISRAVAAAPAGPFLDDSSGPLVCQRDLGGSIDPSPFVDADGRAYLLWKSEGSGDAAPTIWSQELRADGLALTGPARQLVTVDRSFERGVVEAPTLVRQGDTYVLLYAAADWSSEHYSIASATCVGPAGPCTKPGEGRVLTSGSRMSGPGGAELFRDAGGALWAAFHAFSGPNVGYPSSRYLYIARVHLTADGHVRIDATT